MHMHTEVCIFASLLEYNFAHFSNKNKIFCQAKI